MSRTSKLLTKETVEIAESNLLRLGKAGAVAVKLRAIISANKYGITTESKCFGITKSTLISWIKHVKNESLELLNVQKGKAHGHPATAKKQSDKILSMFNTGLSQSEITRKLRIGRTSVRRIIHGSRGSN